MVGLAGGEAAGTQSPVQLTPFQLPLPPSSFAAQHTPEQSLGAQLVRQCAAVAAGAGAVGGPGQASPVETALAIARMVKRCTEQLRSTPLHLRSALKFVDGRACRFIEPLASVQKSVRLRTLRVHCILSHSEVHEWSLTSA